MIFLVWPLVAAGVSFGASLLQRRWAKKDQRELQDYYDPKAQIERLRAAGLSPGMLYDSRAAGQSEMPRNVDVDAGVSNAIAAYSATRLTKLQAKALEQDVRAKQYQADILEKDRNDYLSGNYNKAAGGAAEVRGKELENVSRELRNEVAKIDYGLKKTLYEGGVLEGKERQEFANLMATNGKLVAETRLLFTKDDQAKQETINLITQNEETKQKIVNLVTQNEKYKAEIEKILSDTKHVNQLIEIAYLEEDLKEGALKKLAYELDHLQYMQDARDTLFGEHSDLSLKDKIMRLDEVAKAALFYGLEKVSTFFGGTIK